jgi:hypothetical protein
MQFIGLIGSCAEHARFFQPAASNVTKGTVTEKAPELSDAF